MAIKYEVKKKVFGFDESKTEKFVAQTKVLGLVEFKDLCEEVQKVSLAPRGVVKMVIDGLIDALNMDLDKGYSVQLGDFGYFRPGLNAKSQAGVETVNANTVYRRKIIFYPGSYFKNMLSKATVEKLVIGKDAVLPGNSGNGGNTGGGSGSGSGSGSDSDGDENENPLG